MLFEKFAIFVLFLGPLVFFHELGHFLFARLFGVRVEVFSIGFGPKLFKIRKGFTEYAVSLIPLGGYVKMFGDDPLHKDEIPQELRKVSFTFQNKWARFWIVMGGPLANFILAFAVFMMLLLVGEKSPEIKMGVVSPDSKFYALGVRTGDVLSKVNGKEIYNTTDIMMSSDDMIKSISLNRKNQSVEVVVNQKPEAFFEEFVNYPPALKVPVLVSREGKWFWVSQNENPQHDLSLDEMAEMNLSKVYLWEMKPDTAGKPEFLDAANPMQLDIKPGTNAQFFSQLRSLKDLFSLDLIVKRINPNSPAEKGGVQVGDLAYRFNGEVVYDFEQLKNMTQKSEGEVSLDVLRKNEIINLKLTPEKTATEGVTKKLIGIYSRAEFIAPKFVEIKPLGFFATIPKALYRTWDTMVKTVESFKKLIFREVSFKTIGGPLSIGKVASDSFNTSITSFLFLMAVISINLGVINLFPIPVLDGGHIMFILLEIINRGPISRRKMEIAQQVGLSLLLMLMVGALVNDFSRLI
ncbi:MAG: hypothetical protein COW00_04285 [Bdellovibrio sp. CG12_big_fil_rev_8_21_14_0_65_39_13]|nr:MAG: hypothetical protein COW78_16820 [Bdellovibrio sp. CG22_combo_CG10-13_8_21_14_all_39_27]PIQ61286.1 MAG: hypothetical protein COW00_04285 [Bdellovibrio sp. CG12_big_fil_rev_8_21_14_0_65_39_13]PIR36717.1 MAG: hypothetical protein COV37_01835 [Bdellovibrio sp. CG11_big_fil_rev_8_21_14_0_20_39_38]